MLHPDTIRTCAAGGERAAVIYTLLGTAKLNGLNPTESLSCVLRRIGTNPINRPPELQPWNIDLTPTPGEAIETLSEFLLHPST